MEKKFKLLKSNDTENKRSLLRDLYAKTHFRKWHFSWEKQIKERVNDDKAPLIKKKVIEKEFFQNQLQGIKLFNKYDLESIIGYSSFKGNLKAIFIGLDKVESFLDDDILPLSMIESDQDTLGKMIKSIGLKSGEFLRIPILNWNEDNKEEVLNFYLEVFSLFSPKVIVTLGSYSASFFLEKKVKLDTHHGKGVLIEKKYQKKIVKTLCIPIFHPSFLEINQNMKRVAWEDLKLIQLKL